MGRKDALLKARADCYKEPTEQPEEYESEDIDVNDSIAYDCDTATMFLSEVRKFADESAVPMCEYLDDTAIYNFIQTLLNR